MSEYLGRRGVDFLGAKIVEGEILVTFGCDCGQVTELLLIRFNHVGNIIETAFTCDKCLSVHWVTFEIGEL